MNIVVGVMKMENTAPGVGIEPTSPGFKVSVLIITSPRLPGVTTLPMPTCLCEALTEVSTDY